MGWTYTVLDGGIQDGCVGGGAGASYGWGPLRRFHELLAAELGIDLPTMQRFGGHRPWDGSMPMRLLFDYDYLTSQHPTHDYLQIAIELREIHARWEAGQFASGPVGKELPEWMASLQPAALAKLIDVLTFATESDQRLILRS